MKIDHEWKPGEQEIAEALVDLFDAWKAYNARLAAQDRLSIETVFTKEHIDAVVRYIEGRDNVLAKVDALAKLVSP